MQVSLELSLLNPVLVLAIAGMVILRAIVPDRWRTPLGALTSVALVGAASPPTLLAIAAIVLCWVAPLGGIIRHAKRTSKTNVAARVWLFVGIAGLLAAMIVYKAHHQFLLPGMAGTRLGTQLLSIVGLSYFLFKGINCLVTSYYVPGEEIRTLLLLYYALFPPTITSGPIQRYTDFANEIAANRPLTTAVFTAGIYRITLGCFYKITLVYMLQQVYGTIIAQPEIMAYDSLALLSCTYLTFFLDFAGYSHIAIGLALLLGVTVPENFLKPFLSTTITEFWNRWHITLGRWFRDHIFIPCGGMRRGGAYAAVLAIGIMVLVGLWHGLSLPLLLWGLWHGSVMWIERLFQIRPIPPALRTGPRYWGRVVRTNFIVLIGMLAFIPSSDLNVIVGGFARL